MKKIFIQKNKGGYTIIETMIAVSLFIIIVMMAMNSLLNANVVSNKSQKMRSIMDNMNFVMEDMSRNLRTGYNYHCVDNGVLTATVPYSCAAGGSGISFKSSQGIQWVYYVSNTGKIFKSIDGGVNFVQMTPDEVAINTTSGFTVLGAEPPSGGNKQQPYTLIKMLGTITYQGVVTTFSLQTSVSQRNIDI